MGTESQVLVGYFIKAKCGAAPQMNHTRVCTLDHKHPQSTISHICQVCGNEIGYVHDNVVIPITMWDLQCGADLDWIPQLAKEDVAWINDRFSGAPLWAISGDEGYDYVMCSGYDTFDGRMAGVYPMSVCEVSCPPTLGDIERLQALMHYETTELLFGALVSVSP